jgi:hypothetical protein
VSTAQQIEEAIRSLEKTERDKLFQHLPQLFPELGGDSEWDQIIRDERQRPELTRLLDETEEQLRRDPDSLPEVKASDW